MERFTHFIKNFMVKTAAQPNQSSAGQTYSLLVSNHRDDQNDAEWSRFYQSMDLAG